MGNKVGEIDASLLADYPSNYGMGDKWFEPGKRTRAEFLLASLAERVEPGKRLPEKVEEFLFTACSVARKAREQNLSDSCTGRPGSKKPDRVDQRTLKCNGYGKRQVQEPCELRSLVE